MASPILNVTEFWIASTGEILDQSGTSQFHAQNNYANLILVNLEDGGGYDSTTFINFTPQTKTAYTSHWFYMSYQGLVEHVVGGEVRNFAQYAIRVPRVVLQNSNKNGFTINDVIVKQTYGDNFIGQFDTLASLNSEYPPTEALDDANSVAYVIADADRGFYQVELDGTYAWTLMESVSLSLETKQYNQFQIQVQAGSANPADVVSVSEETVKILMGILNNLQVDVDRIDANIDEIEDDVALLQQFDIDLLAGEKIFNSLTLDTTDTDAPTTIGEIKWDGIGLSTKLTNTVTLQLGRELFAYCRNAESTTITNGTVVYMTNETIGGSPHVLIRRASNNNNTAYKMIGVATHDILTNKSGFITLFGGLDLNSGHGFSVGDTIYLGLNGAMTKTLPTKPNAIIEIGIVKPRDRILIIPKVHFPISMSSDVSITNPQENDILVRNAGGVFVNSQRLKDAEEKIEGIEDGTTLVGRATYDADGNVITDTYETKADATSKLALKVDKDSEIAGVAINDGITLEQLKTAIGLATTSLSGLMSATDKKYLNELYALLDTDDVDTLVNTLGELLAIFESYPEGTDIVQMFATKVDKVLSTYDTLTGENVVGTELVYIDAGGTAKKMTLSELFEASNSSAGAFVPNGVYEDLTAGFAQKSASGVDIDTKFGTIDGEIDDIIDGTQNITFDNTISGLTATTVKDALDEIDGNVDELETRTTVIESKLNVVGLDYKEYGIREVVGQSSSDFERVTRFWGEIKLGSATGLVANVAIDDADATNSFDYIPIFKREVVDIDATDLSSNTVSNTFVKVPKYYVKEEWVTEGETDYHYIFMSQFKHEGYRLPLPFKKPDGSERDYAYMGAYEAFLDGNNKLRSLTGQIPKVSYSRNDFRTAARALDGLGVNSKYQITDLAEYVDLVQIPFMIEFATKHSQGVFAGATSMAYSASHTAIADGTSVNFIVVSNATGAAFVLGQTVSIGTSHSNDSIAKDRIVTQIDVDTPNAGETTITFDGAAVNITTGHVIASRAWKTGMTDNVKVSGTHALNDGKHSIVWRGLENPFGNIWKNVDGVKISNWRGYIAENPKDYNDTASVAGVYAEPYLPLGYLNANSSNYIQDLGYDANYPYAKFPISVQASSGLYFRDYYYQNSGDRTVFVGGPWPYSSDAGLFFWSLHYVLGYTYFSFGARLSYRP